MSMSVRKFAFSLPRYEVLLQSVIFFTEKVKLIFRKHMQAYVLLRRLP